MNQYYQTFRFFVELKNQSHLLKISKPPQPGERKFIKKINATKPKKRKR